MNRTITPGGSRIGGETLDPEDYADDHADDYVWYSPARFLASIGRRVCPSCDGVHPSYCAVCKGIGSIRLRQDAA